MREEIFQFLYPWEVLACLLLLLDPCPLNPILNQSLLLRLRLRLRLPLLLPLLPLLPPLHPLPPLHLRLLLRLRLRLRLLHSLNQSLPWERVTHIRICAYKTSYPLGGAWTSLYAEQLDNE